MLNTTSMSELPVAVLGGGPVGLAAAANLLERGMPTVVLEAGPSVGANLLAYGHVRLFSPWRYNVDPAMARHLRQSGWMAPPPDSLPLASEVVERVLVPFAKLPEVSRALHLDTTVVSLSRDGFDKVKTTGRENAPFVVNAVRDGAPWQLRARAVIDATGTWSHPNPIGANGLPAIGEQAHAAHIFYGIPDVLGAHRARYFGQANTCSRRWALSRQRPAGACRTRGHRAGDQARVGGSLDVARADIRRGYGGRAAGAWSARPVPPVAARKRRAGIPQWSAHQRATQAGRPARCRSVWTRRIGRWKSEASTKSSVLPGNALTWVSRPSFVCGWTLRSNPPKRWDLSSTPTSTAVALFAPTVTENSRTPSPGCTRSASSHTVVLRPS